MFFRIIATVVAFLVYGALRALYSPLSTLAAGQLAGKQFESNDTSAIVVHEGLSFISGFSGLLSLALLVALVAIWYQPVRRFLSTFVLIGLATAGLMPKEAQAYYDKYDYTEPFTIYPNETAFWIPDVGDNVNSQAKMDSEEYFNANKVQLKRFIVPHTKLEGSGTFTDFYVPAGRLILIDRTPYNREWTGSTKNGTSGKDESFHCQDNSGRNVTAEMTIGTSVLEPNAAKFLYRFGVKPPEGDRTKPEVIFTSVYYGRSLVEAMDTVGRGKILQLVCSEISARNLDQSNHDAPVMLKSIQEQAKAFLAEYGITLDYLGWAGTFTFDESVQDSINRNYIAQQDKEIAEKLAPLTETIKALAAADALRAFGNKSDGKLPSTIVGLPSNVGSLMETLMQMKTQQGSMAVPTK